MMGGRVAEELVFGKENITSGASSDIEQATRLARMMVTRWGYSDELGLVAYGENQDEVFLGMSVSRQQNISEETARKIDSEVKRLVHGGYDEAKRILTERSEDLDRLAKALLEFETLSGEEIEDVLKGVMPVRERPEDKSPPPPSVSVPITPPTSGVGLADLSGGPAPEPA
jgi:cell division protease FtsH